MGAAGRGGLPTSRAGAGGWNGGGGGREAGAAKGDTRLCAAAGCASRAPGCAQPGGPRLRGPPPGPRGLAGGGARLTVTLAARGGLAGGLRGGLAGGLRGEAGGGGPPTGQAKGGARAALALRGAPAKSGGGARPRGIPGPVRGGLRWSAGEERRGDICEAGASGSAVAGSHASRGTTVGAMGIRMSLAAEAESKAGPVRCMSLRAAGSAGPNSSRLLGGGGGRVPAESGRARRAAREVSWRCSWIMKPSLGWAMGRTALTAASASARLRPSARTSKTPRDALHACYSCNVCDSKVWEWTALLCLLVQWQKISHTKIYLYPSDMQL